MPYPKLDGPRLVEFTDKSGTPGAATIKTACGRVAIAAGQASVVVTNPWIKGKLDQMVDVCIETADGTLTFVKSVVKAAGQFTITCNANATGTVKISFEIVQPA